MSSKPLFSAKTLVALFALAVCLTVAAQYSPPSGGGGGAGISVPYLSSNGVYYGPVFQVTRPPSTGWTLVNTGSPASTVTPVNGSIQFVFTPNLGNDQVRCYMRALPQSTGYTASIGVLNVSHAVGMALGDGTKYVFAWTNGPGEIEAYEFSGSTSVASQYFDVTGLSLTAGMQWMQWTDDGAGHRLFKISADGQLWFEVNTASTATYLTETQYGLCYETNQTPQGVATLIHSAVTVP